jgi:Leucine-rich repeat (LRR) protein
MSRLSEEKILAKCKVNTLDEVKNLNLWGCDLEDISILTELHNVEVVSLSVNKIRTLKSFSNCNKLTELYLRKNHITSLEDIYYLQECKNLRILWLGENPICENTNYRNFTIQSLPWLVKLDNILVKDSEKVNNFSFNGKMAQANEIMMKNDYMTQIKDLNELHKYFGDESARQTGGFRPRTRQIQNVHVVRAIGNLLEELNTQQLMYLKRLIENKLNK